MVTIRQHGSGGELFDMKLFLSDIDRFFRIDAWSVAVQECLGEGALEIEDRSARPVTLPDAEFRRVYEDIYQTIDGSFVGLRGDEEQRRLNAIDSSYWEISGTTEFEAHMAKKYGTYVYGA